MKLIDKMSSYINNIQMILSFLSRVSYGFMAFFMLTICLALVFFTGVNWLFTVMAVLSLCYFLVCITTGVWRFRFQIIGYILLAVISIGYLIIAIISFLKQGDNWHSLIIPIVGFLVFGIGSLFIVWIEWFGYPKTTVHKIDWYAVYFDDESIVRHGTLPVYRNFLKKTNLKSVQNKISWSHIRQVCFYPKGLKDDDEIELIVQVGNSCLLPINIKGGNELWAEIINRGLFDKALATKVKESASGRYCSSEFYNKEVMTPLTFEANSRKANYWAYGDYYCVSKLGTEIFLPYAGEPPHGDSYHKLIINNKTVEGYLWCGRFVWSPCGRYFACDFDGIKERTIIVVDVNKLKYKIVETPKYKEIYTMLEHDENELWNTLLKAGSDVWLAFQ